MAQSLPLYRRIYEDLRDQIAQGVYPLGSRLPSESELIARYEVSRLTVRRAIAELAADGFLTTEQGRGSFVKSNRLKTSLRSSVTKSFTEVCHEAGVAAGARVVSMDIVRSPAHYARSLAIGEDALLLRIRRIRTADDWPIMDENTYLPYERFKALLSMDLTDASLFSVTEEVGGMRPLHAHERLVDAVIATQDQAKELGIPTGAALLKRSATYVGADGHPISIGRCFFVGGRFTFEL